MSGGGFVSPDAAFGSFGLKFEVPNDIGEGQRRELVEGPARGIELYSRGLIVLHGSCLRIGHQTLDIVGCSGAGKSTLAAMLCQRGAKLVSDGMAPVHPETLEVALGPPRCKLNDESLRLLGQDPAQFTSVHPKSVKRYFPTSGVIAPDSNGTAGNENSSTYVSPALDGSLILSQIFIVEDADETSIVPIRGAESLIKLVMNVYLVEHLPPDHSSILMQRAAAVIRRGVQVKALRRAKEPGRLVEIVEAIEREVGNT